MDFGNTDTESNFASPLKIFQIETRISSFSFRFCLNENIYYLCFPAIGIAIAEKGENININFSIDEEKNTHTPTNKENTTEPNQTKLNDTARAAFKDMDIRKLRYSHRKNIFFLFTFYTVLI